MVLNTNDFLYDEEQQQQQPAGNPIVADPSQSLTPQQVAETSEKTQKDEGWITQLGNTANYVMSGGATSDVTNAIAAGINQITPEGSPLKGITQGVDDFILSSEEQKEGIAQQVQGYRDSGETGKSAVLSTLIGTSAGGRAGLLMPATVAGRIANQETSSWSDPPAIVKDSVVGSIAFEVSETLVASGLFSATAGKALNLGTRGSVIAESVIETATQESAEDLILGETLAVKMGELANSLGYDGNQLTKDLIEGNKPHAQAMVAVAGLLQNLGVNATSELLIKQASKLFGSKTASESAQQVAEATGKDAASVQKNLDDVQLPPQKADYEPHELENIDTQVPVAKPTGSNKYISDDALQAQALKNNGLGDDYMDAAGRDYFSNYRVFSNNESYQQALKEATATLKPLVDTKKDLNGILARAQKWVADYMDEVNSSIDIDRALVDFPQEMTTPLNPGKFDGSVDDYIKNNAITTPEGVAAATIMGEEMGVRLAYAARQAVNLETAGIDFTKSVENFIELSEKASIFLVPLRRQKRKWALEGLVSQRRNIKGLRDADVLSPDAAKETVLDSPARDFTTIKVDEDAPGQTVKELWEAFKEGDVQAGETLKTYLGLIAYANPKTATAQIENLSNVLLNQLKKGNKDATRQLYYSYMLSRISPISSSLSSSIVGMLTQPLGALMRGEKAMGFGQFVGGMAVQSEALQNAARAWKTGMGINAGTKIETSLTNHIANQKNLENLWIGVQKELNAKGASKMEWATAWLNYSHQSLANLPIQTYASRALLATDEWAKTAFAGQLATGRAWKKAAELNLKHNDPAFKQLVQDEMKKVFKDGVATGKIVDSEVLEGAKYMTMQSSIPSNGNVIDQAFYNLDKAASESAFWNFASPFTKVSYNTLEQSGRVLAGSLPVGGEWLLSRIPRYQKIISGEMGEVAQLQLKNQMAFANKWAYGIGGLATMGLMTGNNPPAGMPRTSFIIPAPGSKDGYIAINYSRVEPFATPMALISDLTTGLRDEVFGQGDYNRFMEEMLISLGISTLDKSFTTGLVDTAAMLDVKNFGEGSIAQFSSAGAAITGAAGLGAHGALIRMVTNWTNPYKTIDRVNDNPQENFWLQLGKRFVGGQGNPVRYDPLTGRPELKLGHAYDPGNLQNGKLQGVDYWRAVVGAAIGEVVLPAGTQGNPDGDPAAATRKELDRWDATKDLSISLRSVNGAPLSAQQQSTLSKDLNDFGKLNETLQSYFNSGRYKTLVAEFDKARGMSPTGQTSDGRAADIRDRIKSDINKIYRDAKQRAVKLGRLGKDPQFQMKVLSSKTNVAIKNSPAAQPSQTPEMPPAIEEILFVSRGR